MLTIAPLDQSLMLVHRNLHVTNLYKNIHRLLNQSNKLLNQSLIYFIVQEEIDNLGGLKCEIQHMLDMKLLLCFDDFFSLMIFFPNDFFS